MAIHFSRQEYQQRISRAGLGKKGYAVSTISEPVPVPGGRSKKYFELTNAGVLALKHARETMQRMAEGPAVDSELEAV